MCLHVRACVLAAVAAIVTLQHSSDSEIKQTAEASGAAAAAGTVGVLPRHSS